MINERDCANGQAPTDRAVTPFVTETDETVSIVVLVERVKGDAACPGNPWYPITITSNRRSGLGSCSTHTSSLPNPPALLTSLDEEANRAAGWRPVRWWK